MSQALRCLSITRRLVLIAASVLSTTAGAASYTAAFTDITSQAVSQAEWRGWTAMTWVDSLGGLVMWGGSGGSYLNDIQLFDPTTIEWMTIYPKTDCPGNTAFVPPNGSDENGVVWDAISDRLWIYNGGSGYRCGTTSRIGHTAGAGTTSTSIVDPTLSGATNFYRDWIVRVNGKTAAVTAYDASTHTLTLATSLSVVAGGSYDLFVDFGGGTWSYDFTTGAYSKLQQLHWGYSGYVPAARRSPGFAGDGTKAFLFGGLSSDNGTYKLDFATRAYSIAIAQGSSASPPARGEIESQFVYDSINDRYVLFGGRCYDARCTGMLDDTWVYDPNANRWTQIQAATRPPARNQAFMYFDRSMAVMVLYGGSNGSTVFNDVWTFDVSTLTWTQQTTSGSSPGGLYLGQDGYSPATGCGYIIYGLGPGGVATRRVWRLCLTAAGGNIPPTASFTATPSSTTVGTPIAFSASASLDPDGSIVSYAWDFGDGTSGSGVSLSKTYASAGTYTVKLTVTDNGGLASSTTRTVGISAPNQPPSASFTANPSTTTVGTSIAFSATASRDPDGSIVSYSWIFGDGTTGSGVTVSKSYTAAGTYTVKLTVTDNGGLSSSASSTVTVTSSTGGTTTVWIDDALPPGARVSPQSTEPFTWISSNPTPYSGALAHQSALVAGTHQHYFTGASPSLPVATGDTLFAYVYLDPANPPRQVELQWYDGSWSHRAYWGASLISWSVTSGPGGQNMGPLPPTGQWVRLQVPAALVNLEGHQVNGMAFTLYDGRATWDYAGVVSGAP